MKKRKTHRGYKNYQGLKWYEWLDINQARDRERRKFEASNEHKYNDDRLNTGI